MENRDLINEINRLKADQDAVIVAHYYQNDEVQGIADMTGDSFALASYCEHDKRSTIVFCGVHFMAESAYILSPHKTVLLPEKDAGCPMADMIDADDVRELKKKHPGAAVVCYINTSAEVKAESDICCTSSNAVKIVQSLKEEEILFLPDKNLGSYVAGNIPDKRFHFWEGWCNTHHRIREEDAIKAKQHRPNAKLLVHPECRPEVLKQADFIGSTKGIIEYAAQSTHNEFIIGTEMGIMYQLNKDNPGKIFYLLSTGMICPNMKKISLKSIYSSLKDGKHIIKVEEDIRQRAKNALDRMLKEAST